MTLVILLARPWDNDAAVSEVDGTRLADVFDISILRWHDVVGQPADRDEGPLEVCLLPQNFADGLSCTVVEARLVRICLDITCKLGGYETLAFRTLLAGSDQCEVNRDV